MKTKNIDRQLGELELIALDLRQSAKELEKTIEHIKTIQKYEKEDIHDYDALIKFVIGKRFKKLKGTNTLENQERILWKQTKKELMKKEKES